MNLKKKQLLWYITAVRQDVCSCCVTPCKEMKDSHFKSVTDLNHLAHRMHRTLRQVVRSPQRDRLAAHDGDGADRGLIPGARM